MKTLHYTITNFSAVMGDNNCYVYNRTDVTECKKPKQTLRKITKKMNN